MKKKCELVPSLLSFDVQNWPNYFSIFHNQSINYIHFDVMDKKYVENSAYDENDYKFFLQHNNNLKAHIHLMVINPLNEITKYKSEFTDAICFHFDACKSDDEVYQTLDAIKTMKIKQGIAINPNFKFADYSHFLDECEFITIMGVYPGKGGQKFESSCLNNLRDIQKYCLDKKRSLLIEIDGGMNFDTIPIVVNESNYIVSGSFLANNINEIKNIINWFERQIN
ncbi:MAG: ribulose-phosphate 3-epimerase [Ureaplasma sp.]|nr:ribulose-phosphate 3-epimerase [Ureaplasma sp.]MDE7221725.1 ribulose-phosphate 3-epimerase [Ureaplasma sp.]